MHLENHVVRNLAIVAFLLRGAFYSVEQPMWEGFDEWAHFGYIEHVVRYRRLPSRFDPVSDQLRRSVELAPVSAAAADYSTASITHDAFWRLPVEERLRRERELRGLTTGYKSDGGVSGALLQYEAQQPPLYYLLLALPYLAVQSLSLPAQALTLRIASLLISTLGLFLCYRVALRIPACRRAAVPLLLLLASWPGLLVRMSHIGNDALALALGSAVVLCSFRIVRHDSGIRDWALAGVALGAALLTKSYMLALVPVLPFAALIQSLRQRTNRLRTVSGCMLALTLVGLMAGWWYARTWLATKTLSGEQIDAAAAQFGLAGRLGAIRNINWSRVLESAAATHIWTGGWSFLAVRSWMYRVLELLALIAGVGLAVPAGRFARHGLHRRLGNGDARFSLAACAFVLFCFGLGYFATVVYLTRGISTALGWYLYGIAGAETALLGCGFTGLFGVKRAASCVAAMAALACAFDLYTVHFVSMPYYSGIVAHTSSGRLATFHISDLRGIGLGGLFTRLATNKPRSVGAPLIAALWTGYLFGTAVLMASSAAILGRTFLPLPKIGSEPL